MRRPLLAFAVLFPLAACVSPARSAHEDDETPGREKAGSDQALDGAERREMAQELGELERELQEALLEQRVHNQEADSSKIDAERAVREAEREVTEARDALARYREVEGPLVKAKVQLDVEEAANRLEATRQDLEGILEIYAGEEEARAKQEIIRRSRKAVEIAQRSLDNERALARLKSDFEFPQEVRSLEWALDSAESELREAQRALEHTELEGTAKRLASEHRIANLTAKLESTRAKLADPKGTDKP